METLAAASGTAAPFGGCPFTELSVPLSAVS